LKLLLLGSVIGVIILAALNLNFTKQIFGRCSDLFSRAWATANSALRPGAGVSPAESPSESDTPPVSEAHTQAQSTVEAYMRKNASPQSTVSFLDWSDFSTSGPASAISLRYRVRNPFQEDIWASVRFTVQAGSVVKAEIIDPGFQPARAPAVQPAGIPVRPAPVIDRFTRPLFAAVHGASMTLELSDAFSLAQLEQAEAKAQAERKPLGFIMVWGQFFDHEADPRSKGSDSALVHFYEVFNQQLVLVFVRHETELGMVPVAVRRGFSSVNEGGYAPNMAVVDATATEFIVEIPFRNLDGNGRDQLFAAGGRVIDQWLATHPEAVPTPGPAMPDGN